LRQIVEAKSLNLFFKFPQPGFEIAEPVTSTLLDGRRKQE
jgi:hypothetical protein